MLTYQEHIALRDQLEAGSIDVKTALQQYWKDYKKGQKPWDTKDWKERRAVIIKDKCEICCSTDKLTLQHGSHPHPFGHYKREITRTFTTDFINAGSKVDKGELRHFILKKYVYNPVPFCPNCNYSNPNERKRKLPKYLCPNCRHEFDVPVYKTIDELIAIFYENEDALVVRDKCFVSKYYNQKQNLSNIKYWLLREHAKSNNEEPIERKAFLLYLNDCIHYLSFAGTITACQKCAYHEDIKKMDLCPACKQNYKGIEYPTCVPCLPEEKRQAALELIEFAKQWRDMHEDLGID